MQNVDVEFPAAPGLAAATPRRRSIERPPIATRLNLFLICLVLCGTLFQLFGMPCILRKIGFAGAWLLVPIMLIQPIHWGLIHEGIHSHLLSSRRQGEFCARLLSIVHWLPFDATRFCHLVHHRYSRHAYDRPDVYDGRGPYLLAWLRYRGRLFGGVYLGLLVSPLIAFMPISLGTRIMAGAVPQRESGDADIRRLFVSLVENRTKRGRTQRDFILTLALYGTSAWVYGSWWPMLLATLYARALWHSLADNIPHHDVALDEPERARNYALSRFVAPLVLNHHLHLTHHLNPTAPWTALAHLSRNEPQSASPGYFQVALSQSRSGFPKSNRPIWGVWWTKRAKAL